MKRTLVVLVALLAGCAADPKDLKSVALTESARMAAPSKPLSGFGAFELAPMTLSEAVRADSRKVAEAKDLETRLRTKLDPLLAEWNAGGSGAPTLRIVPELASLHIVSGGARFWAGAMVGESNVDLDLELVDAATNEVIAKPRIQRSSGSMAGAWSVGKTDQNLLDYVVAIAYEYLASHR